MLLTNIIKMIFLIDGWLAQLAEHMLDVHGAIGSSPIPPIICY